VVVAVAFAVGVPLGLWIFFRRRYSAWLWENPLRVAYSDVPALLCGQLLAATLATAAGSEAVVASAVAFAGIAIVVLTIDAIRIGRHFGTMRQRGEGTEG
jgi:hypothetical protein